MPHRLQPSGGAQQEDPLHLDAAGAQYVQGVRAVAEHALDGRPGQVLGGHRLGPQAGQGAGRVRQRGRPLAVQVGEQHQPVRAGGGLHGEVAEALQVAAEQGGGGAQHLGGVQGGDHRQVAAGGVGEGGDQPGGVHHGLLVDREDRPGAAERDHRVPGAEAEAERGGHVVPGAGRDQQALGGVAGGFGGAEHVRQLQLVAQGQFDQVLAVLGGDRGPVAGAGSVAPVGGAAPGVAEQLPDQPVVREQHLGDPPGVGRLELGEPAQFGDGVGGAGDGADRCRPGRGAAQFVDQGRGGAAGARIVPQDRRPDQHAAGVEADQAVLLRADADRPDALQQSAGRGVAEGVQPELRIGLAGAGVRVLRRGVFGLAGTQDGAGG